MLIWVFKKEKKEKRFIIKEEQSLGFGVVYVILDTHTGVHYIAGSGTSIKDMTSLLDSDGNVIINK